MNTVLKCMTWHGPNQPEKKVEIEVRNTGPFPVPEIPERMLLVFLRFQLNRNSGYLFLPLKTEVLKFHTVLFSVYFVSVRSL